VTLKASTELTGLDLTIRVVTTPGLTAQGADAPPGMTSTVEHKSGALIYHFVLNKGAALPAGEYAFVARYATPGHDAIDDTYEALGTDVDHKRPHVYGNFAATKKQ